MRALATLPAAAAFLVVFVVPMAASVIDSLMAAAR